MFFRILFDVIRDALFFRRYSPAVERTAAMSGRPRRDPRCNAAGTTGVLPTSRDARTGLLAETRSARQTDYDSTQDGETEVGRMRSRFCRVNGYLISSLQS